MKIAGYIVAAIASFVAVGCGTLSFLWTALETGLVAAIFAAIGLSGGVLYAIVGAFLGGATGYLLITGNAYKSGDSITPEALSRYSQLASEAKGKAEVAAKSVDDLRATFAAANRTVTSVATITDYVKWGLVGLAVIVVLHFIFGSLKTRKLAQEINSK